MAYIWAVRIPNVEPPSIRIGKTNYIPEGQKTAVPVEVPGPQWQYLQRARSWTFEGANGQKFTIPVLKLGNQRALELNLSKTALPSGEYHLTGFWDWTKFQASGDIFVQPLSDFERAKLQAESQDNLLAKTGKIPVKLGGDDFEFLTKVQLRKLNDEFAVAEPVRFILPTGSRQGPQSSVDLLLDTTSLEAGKYQLLLSQPDDKVHSVAISVLAGLPKITNLPILANQGVAAAQHYVLKGERLNLLSKLTAAGASFEIGPSSSSGTERSITVRLDAKLKPGIPLGVEAAVSDRTVPMIFPNALQITGPLPAIASSRLSLPGEMAITLPADEFPVGSNLAALLDVRNLEPKSVVRLSCAEDVAEPVSLRVGEQTTTSSLQRLSADQLFLSFDTSRLPAGCLLQAVIDNGRAGRSQPFELARMIRLPQIESLEHIPQPQTGGVRAYLLTGWNLEMIEKVGWDSLDGAPIASLPAPVPGPGQKQSLKIELADPASGRPQAFYIWLRGEQTASATNITVPSRNSFSSGADGVRTKAERTATFNQRALIH